MRRFNKKVTSLCFVIFLIPAIYRVYCVEVMQIEGPHYSMLLFVLLGLPVVVISILTSPEHEDIFVGTKLQHIIFWVIFAMVLVGIYMLGYPQIIALSFVMYYIAAMEHNELPGKHRR